MINNAEKAIDRRIFEEFADGRSARAIASATSPNFSITSIPAWKLPNESVSR
jgi:hypothetical protein